MKKYLLAVLLFIFGSIVLYGKFQEQDHRLLSLEVFGDKSEIISNRSGELVRGDIVKGSFKAKYNKIGQVTVRFNNNFHDSKDIMIFRLREKGEDGWYYQAKYKTDQFLPHRLFPFGFPVIPDSKGKTYEFELESLNGVQGTGISLDTKAPIFTVKTMFTKSELFSNKIEFTNFIIQKIYNLSHYIILFFYSYSLLIYYIFLYFVPIVKINIISQIMPIIKMTIILSLILSGAFIIQTIDDSTIAIVVFMYLLYSNKNQLESRITLFIVIIQLLISLVLLIFGKLDRANLIAIWGYIFLWVFVFQQIAENTFHLKPKASLENFFS